MTASIKHLDQDGAAQLSAYNWPDVYAGVAQTARKFGVENNGDRVLNSVSMAIAQVGSNDGYTMEQWALDTVTLSRPYGVGAVLSTAGQGGTWDGVGYQYWTITAFNATGETIGAVEVAVYIDDTTKKVTLSWTQVTGATGYKVYRSGTSGVYTTPALRTTINSGATVSYIDTGGAVSSGAPPAVNTTAGAAPPYGTCPALAQTPISFGSLAVGQQAFYWIKLVVPGGTSEVGNLRLGLRQFQEN